MIAKYNDESLWTAIGFRKNTGRHVWSCSNDKGKKPFNYNKEVRLLSDFLSRATVVDRGVLTEWFD